MTLYERAKRNVIRADNAAEDMLKGKIDWDEADQIRKQCDSVSRAITAAVRSRRTGRKCKK
jgi:hypothetical protein